MCFNAVLKTDQDCHTLNTDKFASYIIVFTYRKIQEQLLFHNIQFIHYCN